MYKLVIIYSIIGAPKISVCLIHIIILTEHVWIQYTVYDDRITI